MSITQTIIIDGYNFLKNAAGFRCSWNNIQTCKERLSDALFSFNQRRNHSITIVYDGWKNGNVSESYEKTGGIHIIHSRKGETADKVIMRLCEESHTSPLVVTEDREIISAVVQNGGKAITPGEFQRKISSFSAYRPADARENIDSDRSYDRARTDEKGPGRRLSRKKKRKRQAILDSL